MPPEFNRTATDQLGRKLTLPIKPMRIVSLVPSQTELLASLGLADRVVGITKFCLHPTQWLSQKRIVGGTKQVHYSRVKELQPDLIIANKEENTQEIVEALAKAYPVWVSNIVELADALNMIGQVGFLTNTEAEASNITATIKQQFAALKPKGHQRALYLIWRKPYMASGQNTFINDMLGRCGFTNVLPENSRYPEITPEELKVIAPELILLSSEPYPFKNQHIAELQNFLPEAEIKLVDGEMFSWYGSRLQYAPAYFRTLMH